MSKYKVWWDSLHPNMKEYLKKQPIWYDRDLYKVAVVAGIVGFVIGFVVGFEAAWKPVITSFRPLVG
jgi:hypothetical protein